MLFRLASPAVVLVAVLSISSAPAGTIFVNGSCGNDAWSGANPDCAAPDGPKATIQAGINAAASGDEVVVAPGTYPESIDFLGKAITVHSDRGPQQTALEGEASGTGCTFQTKEGPDSVLRGFTLSHFQRGILCDGSSPTIIANIIASSFDPTDGGRGAGIKVIDGNPTIVGCTISDNLVGFNYFGDGGGLALLNSMAQISNCTFSGNTAVHHFLEGGFGGGFYIEGGAPTFTNCVVSGNQGGRGGGGYISPHTGSSATFVDCSFTDNDGWNGAGGVAVGGRPVFTGCTFCGNNPDDLGGGSIENIGGCFASSCGDNNGNGLPDYCDADLDHDGMVGIIDFLKLLILWGPCPTPCTPGCPADLDGDCSVGLPDFVALRDLWG